MRAEKGVKPMLAVQGYYDGTAIRTLEKLDAKPNQRVIITVMDEFVEPRPISRKRGIRGILAQYWQKGRKAHGQAPRWNDMVILDTNMILRYLLNDNAAMAEAAEQTVV